MVEHSDLRSDELQQLQSSSNYYCSMVAVNWEHIVRVEHRRRIGVNNRYDICVSNMYTDNGFKNILSRNLLPMAGTVQTYRVSNKRRPIA